jgi:hypothetical protein
LRARLKIGRGRLIDVDEGLGVSIDHWKPSTLNLDHDPMSRLKGVIAITQAELKFRNLTRHHWLWRRITIAKLASEDLSRQEHLEITHRHSTGFPNSVTGIDIN